MDSYRMNGSSRKSKTSGQNHPGGLMVNYYIDTLDEKDTLSLSFFEENGKFIKSFSTKPDKEQNEGTLKAKKGANQFNWNLKYPDAERVKGMILWWSNLSGPTALPGNYIVKLNKNGKEQSQQNFTLLKHPQSSATIEDLKAQFNFVLEIQEKLTETHKTLKKITKAKKQVKSLKSSISDKETYKEIIELADKIIKNLTKHEEALYQTKSKSNQDPLNFPIRLNNKLGHLSSLNTLGDFKPTNQSVEYKNEAIKLIDVELEAIYSIFEKDLKALNKKIKQSDIDFINLN